jgi:hypothetical protein
MANNSTACGQRENLGLALGNGINLTSVQWNFTDLKNVFTGVASGTAGTSNLFVGGSSPPFNVAGPTLALGQGSIPLYIRVKHFIAFSGGTLSALTVEVGKLGGATNFFTTAFNIFQAVADGTLQEVVGITAGQLSSITPTITFRPTGDALANITAGGVAIDILWAQVTTPSQYVANNVVVNSSPL